ncbi:MAG: SDR family NAD(P)-dependent oxidoreductase [Bacteroidetes bacterium]|nr:SDR family NAD(P)-dependent oxidoreductase [Bacteroidota bacterium]
MRFSKNKILVTGGASGIGFAMAERFVNEGNTVIICGRREPALKEAAEKIPSLITTRCDLSSASDREALATWIAKEHSDLNVLVNNAGIQHWMSISDADFFSRAKEEIAINIEAPLHLTSLFLNLKSLTTIMNVASGLSFVPLIKTPVYSATKAFIHSFTLSLQTLLKSNNIEVIEIVPPALNTDLGGKGIHDFAPPVSGFIESIFEQLKEGKTQLTYQFTDAVSKAGQEVFQPVFARINQLS